MTIYAEERIDYGALDRRSLVAGIECVANGEWAEASALLGRVFKSDTETTLEIERIIREHRFAVLSA